MQVSFDVQIIQSTAMQRNVSVWKFYLKSKGMREIMGLCVGTVAGSSRKPRAAISWISQAKEVIFFHPPPFLDLKKKNAF